MSTLYPPILEREIDARPGHSEIVLRTINNVPAEITHPADVGRDTNFKTATELSHTTRFGLKPGTNYVPVRGVKMAIVMAAEDPAAATPDVRRKASAPDRITQR